MEPEAAHKHKRDILAVFEQILGDIESSTRKELEAKERILVAELAQDDKFTKRARPTVVYTGLVLVLFEVVARYVTFWFGVELPESEGKLVTTMVPAEFWYAWGGICGTWVIGRSAEKWGYQNKIVGYVTGNGDKQRKRSLFE
jgi:hypothetical protein